MGSQVITGGGLPAEGSSGGRGKGVLALKRKITELTDRFGEASVEVVRLEGLVRVLDEEIANLDAKRMNLNEQLRPKNARWPCFASRRSSANGTANASQHTFAVLQERSQLETELSELEAQLAEAQQQVIEAETRAPGR